MAACQQSNETAINLTLALNIDVAKISVTNETKFWKGGYSTFSKSALLDFSLKLKLENQRWVRSDKLNYAFGINTIMRKDCVTFDMQRVVYYVHLDG